MARKSHNDALGVAGAETIIGTGVIVHGELKSEADVIIDGQLEGSLTTLGDITIGVNARIKAKVTGSNVTVSGHLTGNIFASGEAVIRETGQVEGDITSSGLAIMTGGVFVGRSHMPAIADFEPAPAIPPGDTPTKK